MNGKPVLMLGMAVVCGLGAMYGTSRLLSKREQPVVEMQDVLVAACDLAYEVVLNKPEVQLKVVRMEKSAVPIGSFSQAKDVEDRWVQTKLLEGEPIVDRKLAPRGMPPGLLPRIPKGMRAFAIEVNEQTGVSGFVLPDHHVDVIQVAADKKGEQEAETVLQDVLVLAAGQVFSRPEDRTVQARTVTLAVTQDQAEVLVAAQARGELSLSLRPLNDHTVREPRKKKEPEPEPKPAEVIVEQPPPPPPPLPPPPPARFVVIYRGRDGAQKVRIDQPPETPPLASVSEEPIP